MKKSKVNENVFIRVYLSIVQIIALLLDPTFLFGELGRGSGKTTHILAPRIDRIQNDMPGALLVLAAATYKSILDNIVPGILEYFLENYERGVYFEYGKRPPAHFGDSELNEKWSRDEIDKISDFRHTITFVNGTVIKFVSCDRPESMLGLNAAHLFIDEMIRIPEEKFLERIMPALRADRSKFGHSHYYMGITGFSSTPNFETDEDWWIKNEKDMDQDVMDRILEIAYVVDLRRENLLIAKAEADTDKINKLQRFVDRWSERLNKRSDDPDQRGLRVDQTAYLRASSFSNIKILGIDYIKNQIKTIKDPDKLNTSILAVRKYRVKDMFFGKFSKQHLFDDSYDYKYIDRWAIGEERIDSSRNLKHCNANLPLIAGYDPGPFQSIVFGQEDKRKNIFRIIKDMWVYHPEQHAELAEKIDTFFKHHQQKVIYLYYDRAGNQQGPAYRKYYPLLGTMIDSDANLLAIELTKRGWTVHMMSKGQPTIYYSQHYRLLNTLFGKPEGKQPTILIDRNECEALVSSINHSPLKKGSKEVELDKSSERELEFEDQAMYSTQLSSALMYLLWGKFKQFAPDSDQIDVMPQGAGTYTG
ncbi:hypothetical protein LJC00_03665 [Dysgonomonas sp. OttesenSCG-928-M03]|nr:hypothetical protein [Dysgonomonas sp. OttesenSCG-928-M03]